MWRGRNLPYDFENNTGLSAVVPDYKNSRKMEVTLNETRISDGADYELNLIKKELSFIWNAIVFAYSLGDGLIPFVASQEHLDRRTGIWRSEDIKQITETILPKSINGTSQPFVLKAVPLTKNMKEVHGIPKPYDFGYNIQDEYGNNQFRQESSNAQGIVKGSYGYTDAFGLHRRVEYVADENGFRAEVKSNEPGVKDDQPASAHFTVEEVPQQIIRVLSSGNNHLHRHHDHPESASLRLKTVPTVRAVAASPRTKQ
ncbi:uncharacterized protein LOC114828050 [Galendromus occidentalis]|uniref:Uncharacterized protein LOC114828050 n=1 Tax=Galendromus occidentalis TaxID=34638 RepID=A0AAJ7WGW2_9ACAR|nr:uncharacterized protein LOC114828050 [Galendromus occidentalis]